MDTEILRGHMYQLNVHKSVGPVGIHPRVPKEPADAIITGPLSFIQQKSWGVGRSLRNVS